jgi:predicted transcriptional regulator
LLKNERIPPLELEALKSLWALGEATVREVQAEMNHRRPLAYTTVLTLMDRLAARGVVTRRKQGRAHIYQATLAREVARELAIDRLAHDYFDGSREMLLHHLQSEPPLLNRDRQGADLLDPELL